MIKLFDKSKVKDELGIFYLPDAFNVDEKEVDEFDKQFEYMEKKVQDGQLNMEWNDEIFDNQRFSKKEKYLEHYT